MIMPTGMSHTVKSRIADPVYLAALLLFTVFFLPLGALDADLGVGIGLVHATVKAEDELPDFAERINSFRDFPTFILEAGIPLSELIKLSAKLYPHSRNYTLWDRYDDDLQLMEYYLDMPLSLRARIGQLELGGGFGIGYKFTRIGISDFIGVDDSADYDDHLPTLMTSFNLGVRFNFNADMTNSLDLEYYEDLGPFSEAWGTKVFHKRFVASLSHRFKTMTPRQEVVATQGVSAALRGTNLSLGAGFHLATLRMDQAILDEVESFDHDRGMWLPVVEIGRMIHPYIEIYSGISTNRRNFRIEEEDNWRDQFGMKTSYLDIPLQLRCKLYNVEISAGPNLSVLGEAKYTLEGNLDPEHQPYEAANLIPGARLGVRLSRNRWGFDVYYIRDLLPFSENYNTDKYQDRIMTFFSYRIGGAKPIRDLLPPELVKQQPSETHYFAGIKKSIWGGSAKYSYIVGIDKVRRFPDGFGFGSRLSAGALKSNYAPHESLSMLDVLAQARFSYKPSSLELWAGPGIGLGWGVAVDSQLEYFPIFPFILPRLSAEAGIRLQVLPYLAMDVSWEESSILSVYSIFGVGTTQLRFDGAPYLGLALNY